VEAQEGLRVPPPDKYDGKPASLEEFIMKSRMYIGFQNHRFKYDIERILFMITRFEGRAYSWIEPHVTDYWTHKKASTGEVSTSCLVFCRSNMVTLESFVRAMRKAFGDIDKKKKSEFKLLKLTQDGSAAKYFAEF
jgi:hypothetical protein